GTSLAGQCCNVAVVMDHSKYFNRILEMNPRARLARVQPGIVLDALRDEAVKAYGLTFGPDPSTHSRCTLGGMIGNNSCGTHAQWAGRTAENVEQLEVLTYDGLRLRVGRTSPDQLQQLMAEGGRRGEIYRGLKSLIDRYGDLVRERYPKIPRRVSGYNLDELLPERGFNVARALVGTEGTCVTFLEATVRLLENPSSRSLLVLGYEDIHSAADHVVDLLPFKPIALEALDQHLIRGMVKKRLDLKDLPLLPKGGGWLLVEFGGRSREESDSYAREAMAALRVRPDAPTMSLFDDKKQEQQLWEIREAGLGATARIPGDPDTWEGWEDSAVPPERMGDYLRGFKKLVKEFGYDTAMYGHFGQGCLHCRINFDLHDPKGVATYRNFVERAADLVVSMGGSLSGEHGDGQSRAELLPKMFGEELVRAFGEFKAIWDPTGKMNPHKIADPYRLDENLRLGPDWKPRELSTHFAFPEEDGSFIRATTRCVGVGACRRHDGGVMCPSYMVTKEEKHSTRGRAHLLFEMMRSDSPVEQGWKSEAVKDALDLCLACKGCVSDCPVNVDMASYKAEFLSHYYEHKARPRSAYAFGLIGYTSQLASRIAPLANAATQLPFIRSLTKWAAGVAKPRQMPKFASVSLQALTKHREEQAGAPRGEVVLFPDTFNNFFHPKTGFAALEFLEEAGFNVSVPQGFHCCGRPLYDYGFLGLAKERLRATMEQLRGPLERGAFVVVLEPSCASVFRHELLQFFPDDPLALRMSRQTKLISEVLEERAKDWEPATRSTRALVQPHCHHHAVMTFDAEAKWLEKLGVKAEQADSGCCGMAGAFGFEKEHYGVSVACGERKLLPKIRAASDDVEIVANGFSCREQIRQETSREATHFAELAHAAVCGEGELERSFGERKRSVLLRRAGWMAALSGGALATALLLGRRRWR
ncbi:MAG: FAD-binding and (Fe-S)-binding domain-containing protein, partial [Myxococcaceae bacterium]